ncbi:MAG: hypothetical protein C0469_06640 [Cyanobacteria bacterium DS2.3.42]|nr:hypothetical protein [Cyanobacteria bacterium DS2.3.42]
MEPIVLGFVGQTMFNDQRTEKYSSEKSIQPNGYLMVLNVENLEIVQASSNFSTIVVGGAKTIIGRTFENLFGSPIAANLKRRINKDGRILMLISGDFPLFGQRKFNCFIQTIENKIIVEMEESFDSAEPSADQTASLTDAVAVFGKAESITDLLQMIPREIKQLSGFERVMLYRLDQAMTGEIISEEVSPGMDSFLNHCFPAEDISFETCEAYCRNTVWVVSDSNYEPASIVGDGDPIDLSNCALASLSISHIEQLRKHGIGASLSISIVCNDRLWGLIVCHNRTPKPVHHWLRSYCEVVGKLISLKVSAYEDSAQRDLKEKLRRFFDGIRENPTRQALDSELLESASTILELFDGKGMALISHGKIETYPKTPENIDISKYAEWLRTSEQKSFFVEDNLREKFPLEGMIESASGVITMSFPPHHLSLHIFRPELTQTFTWASALFMSVDKGRAGKPAFETLRQTIEKHSQPWTLNQMFMAQVFFDSMKSVLSSVDNRTSAIHEI